MMKDAAGDVSVEDRIVWTVPVRAKKLCVPVVVLSQTSIMVLMSVLVTAPERSASTIDVAANKSICDHFFMAKIISYIDELNPQTPTLQLEGFSMTRVWVYNFGDAGHKTICRKESMKIKTMLVMALGALAAGVAMAGDLAVSAYWQDHMVLQRGKPITVWGKDLAGRTVTVSFAGQTANATTDANGFWETTFAQPFTVSATAQTLTISNSVNEVIALTDILVGDVFLANGQSNMDRRLEDKAKSNFEEPQSIKDFCGDDSGIRFLRIARSAENATSGEQLFDLPPIKAVNDTVKYYGEGYDWSPATGTNRNYVSSVALNFAHYVRRANAEKGQNIPIGIIHASSGGTAIREWIAPSGLNENDIYSPGSAGSSDGWFWNNMMAPILRAKFRAVLWYQGCSDAQRTVADYKKLMDVLVQDRRNRWGDGGDLPFYAVQIATPGYSTSAGTVGLDQYPAPTEDNVGHNYVRVREAQRLWDASDAGAHGLVTTVDCVPCMGVNDLHPVDKNFIGRRLSLFARRDIYGETDLQTEGPAYTRAVREANGAVRIFFKSGTAKGLTAGRVKPASSVAVSQWVKKSTDPIRGFALCDANGTWQDAEATVEGETVVIRAANISTPTQFHYGYWCITRSTDLEDGQRLNLYNGDGLPMSPVAPQAVEDPDASGKVADPVLTPASCFFSPSTNVTIACATSGATIRYTLDGNEPTASSTAYSAPIVLTATTTVKARAFAANKEASDIVFATYTLGEAPAPEPNPLWEPGMYKFAEWTPLANNLLSGLTTAYVANSLDPWNGSVVCLTDGSVSSDLDDATVGIGVRDGATLSWSFTTPKTIETIRLTACGYNHLYKYDKILVVSVEVLQNGEWNQIGTSVSFNGPDSYGSDQSLYATLADDVTGRLATNVTGLRINFGDPRNLGKCRYAEIEASGYDSSGGPTETVATPAFSPAACSFFPSTNVALSCATAGATIRYTLDGTAPTASSTPYSTPIPLAATTTVKARAYAEGMSPSAVVTATYTYVDPVQPTYDITITAPQNGTLETSVTNNVAAGTTVTVIATPASGYRLASVTTNGAAIVGTTFAMPAGDVTLAATFAEQGELTHMFYVGGTGYDSWAAAYNAVQNGATITVGANAEISGTVGKTFVLDLCGHSVEISSGWWCGTVTVIDSAAHAGRFIILPANGMNFSQSKVDFSALTSTQVSGKFQLNADSCVLTFPGDRSFADCTSAISSKAKDARIVVQGVTYTWDGFNWVSDAPGHAITITVPQNGMIETSATNNVAAGTVVTVTATPAEGYQLVSVTTNGTALAGNTFTMPSEDVTVAATFEETLTPPDPPASVDKKFYIGETGYDSWVDAYNAAQNGDTITVGTNAVMVNVTEGKTLTIDLAGRSLEWGVGGWMYGTRTVIDSVGGGQLTLPSGNRNVSGGTVDLSSLTADQITGTGKFWTRVDTVVKFPSGMALADCTPRIDNPSEGQKIVVQGVTYVYSGSSWVPEGKSYPEWIDATSQTLTTKYDTWAAKFNVTDPTAAQKDAYLLNCTNTAEAVATAKAAFTVVSIAVNVDGTVDVGLPTAPEGGFNGTVTIMGCETVDGTYHAVTPGTLLEALYRVPATSNDHFFKASLDM